MDDLLREFLTETNESLDVVDVELVRFEQDPNNEKILANIFRLVHTIKGTCGFLGLPRLEALAHAAETLMGKFRDGMPVTGAAVTLILSTIDRVKQLLDELEQNQQEPAGEDRDLIGELERMVLAAAPDAKPDAKPVSRSAAAAAGAGAASTGVSRNACSRSSRDTSPGRSWRSSTWKVSEPAVASIGFSGVVAAGGGAAAAAGLESALESGLASGAAASTILSSSPMRSRSSPAGSC